MSAVLSPETVVDPDRVEARVLGVLKEVLALDEEPKSLDVSISTELGLNSLDQLSLFLALEDEFGGRISEEDAAQLTTLRDVVEHIRKRMRTAPSE